MAKKQDPYRIVRSVFCNCCKQIAGVHADGRFAWHDYPIIFDGSSVEGFSIGLCYMSGKEAPEKEK
jgi:hypothetical protein